MSITEKKEKLHQYINQADQKEVERLLAFLEEDKEEIIGYTVDGKALSREAYIREINEAKVQARKGKYITQEDLEGEAENW